MHVNACRMQQKQKNKGWETTAKQSLALWQGIPDKERKCPSYILELSFLISTICLPDTDNSLFTKQYNHCEMEKKN